MQTAANQMSSYQAQVSWYLTTMVARFLLDNTILENQFYS
jgi:hypothetical protein